MDEYWKKVGQQVERDRAAAELSADRMKARASWRSLILDSKAKNVGRRIVPNLLGQLRCTHCCQWKQPAAFYRHLNAFMRRMGWCKNCLRARGRA